MFLETPILKIKFQIFEIPNSKTLSLEFLVSIRKTTFQIPILKLQNPKLY